MAKKLTAGMTAICGFQLCTVRKVEGDKIKAVAYCGIEMSGYDLLCFFPTEENKALADKVKETYDQMGKIPGTNGANWPMIHAYLEQNCAHAMAGMIEHQDVLDKAETLLNELLVAAAAKSKYGFALFR